MPVEVGIPPYRVVLDQTPSHGPGGDRWVWSVSVLFEDQKATEYFSNRDSADAFFQSTIKILKKSYSFIERKHNQNVSFNIAMFFFLGTCFGAGIVLLSKFVFT